ncbi:MULTISPECIES: hypothetical protein [Polaromonas]|uniref:DUF4760 domain-containing protein n=1 Tax=Polaromonas aquatica TaxID=332657 RepID=A0ABW1U4A8_9BURK
MNLGSTEVTNLISYVALIVSATLAIFYLRDRSHAKYAIERDYCNQLLTWHASVVDLLIELCVSSGRNVEEKHPSLIKLSSLIEQGRFYFPNIAPENYGQDKPPAYRGYRNIALDFLVASYNLHHKPHTEANRKQAINLQRQFTSVVFEIVRPSDRLSTIRKLTDKYFVKNLSIEDLERREQIDAVSHMWDTPESRD